MMPPAGQRGPGRHAGQVTGQRHAAVHRQFRPAGAGRRAQQHQVTRDDAAEDVAEGEEGGGVHRARGEREHHHQ